MMSPRFDVARHSGIISPAIPGCRAQAFHTQSSVKNAWGAFFRRFGASPAQGEGVSYPPGNRATLQHSLAASSPDPTMPIPAADWCARYCEALAYWSGFHAPSEAARLAWGEMENRWHQAYGERIPSHVCAGCGKLIGGLPALEVGHGMRVHIGELDCVIRFGQRWRKAATAALHGFGLDPPTEFDLS